MAEKNKLKLVELIDTETLQKFQDAFSDMVGMAALTTDENGTPVTKGSNFTEYCMKYTRQSDAGRIRCEECDRYGAVMTHDSGKPTSYYCHSGLVDFAAPILAEGEMIGSFIGGQVLPEPPDREKTKQVADEIGVDFDEYWDAINKVQVIEKERIDRATNSLFSMSLILSDIAMSRYHAIQGKKEIERAAKMKSDFLANMSHEIRTPMNAVIGLAEMTLREELPDAARNYITQIKSSGRALLSLINDILDFSKIESGKLDISMVEYEPMSLFNDVMSIAMTRVGDKELELLLDIDTDIPHILFGDNLRIRQILINLVNNSIKFTNEGQIKVIVRQTRVNDKLCKLDISVKDTGIGIKKDEIDKIFESFQQIDSKRNREVEGTGLGLSITKSLLALMEGELSVESTYGKGSVFSFFLPQEVIDPTPSMSVKNPEKKHIIGLMSNGYLSESLIHDAKKFSINAVCLDIDEDPIAEYEKMRKKYPDDDIFFFFDHAVLNDELENYIGANKDLTAIIVTRFGSRYSPKYDNIRVVSKPLSAMQMSMILNHEKISFVGSMEADVDINFTAPDADVLIVDDNAVNLTVAEGLLEPLQMKIMSAQSGQEAIKLIDEGQFDIIFMDHMMPGMDGVETTHIIRRMYPNYDDVPIIALTANAMSAAKEMFLAEGMNDFIAKPIELRVLLSKVKQWLPPEKVHKLSADEISASQSNEDSKPLSIGDLDTYTAISMLGSQKIYMNILKEYYRVIEKKTSDIREYKANENWQAYTIEVHALKSSSKQIGAMELSAMAAELEKAGNAGDVSYIDAHTNKALDKYLSYIDILKPYCEDDDKDDESEKTLIDNETLTKLLDDMLEACDNLDMDEMVGVCNKLSKYSYPDDQSEFLSKLRTASDNIDADECEDIISEWREVCQS